MGSSGPSDVKQTSTTSPPSWAVPYFESYLQNLYGMTYPGAQQSPYAPGSVAPFSPMQQQAFGAIEGMGATSPLATAGAGEAQKTLEGGYLGPNPYLDQYAQQAARKMVQEYQYGTAPDVAAQAVSQGALGGSGHQQAQETAQLGLSDSLASLMAGIYEPAYQFERGQQATAAGQVPSLVSAGYIPSQALGAAGTQQQQQQQNILNTIQQNLTQKQLWPYQAQQMMGQGLGTVSGGNQVTVSPNLAQGMK